MMELHRQWHGGDKSKESEAKILDSVASGNPPCKEWLPSLMDYVKCTDASGAILRDIAHCAKVFAPSSATGVRLLGKVFMDRLNFMFSRVEGGKEVKAFPLLKAAIIKAQLTGPDVQDITFSQFRDRSVSCPRGDPCLFDASQSCLLTSLFVRRAALQRSDEASLWSARGKFRQVVVETRLLKQSNPLYRTRFSRPSPPMRSQS